METLKRPTLLNRIKRRIPKTTSSAPPVPSKRFLEAKKSLKKYSRDEVESMVINWMFHAQELQEKINLLRRRARKTAGIFGTPDKETL